MADFTKAIELDPYDATTYNNRGIASFRQGELAQAMADYTHSLALNPQFAEAYYNRGVVYAANKVRSRAIADFQKALSLSQDAALRSLISEQLRSLGVA
jgi:tetratricopeptide (TPR) repeat protein